MAEKKAPAKKPATAAIAKPATSTVKKAAPPAAASAPAPKAAAPAAKPAAPAAAAKPAKAAITPEQRWKLVAEAAYYLAEKRGFAAGHANADWLAAEKQVDAKLRS